MDQIGLVRAINLNKVVKVKIKVGIVRMENADKS